jgi:peptidoglycan/LPS O-acetylase OafA/YrhL
MRAPRLAGASGALILVSLFVNPPVLSPFLLTGFAGLILGLSQPGSRLGRILESRPAVYLGEVSFALYMSHGLFQKVIKIVLPSAPFVTAGLGVRTAVVLFYMLSMLSIAALIYHAVERPARDYLRTRTIRATPRTDPHVHPVANSSEAGILPAGDAVLSSTEPESISAHL